MNGTLKKTKRLVMVGIMLFVAPAAMAQSFVDTVDFGELEAIADETVDVTLDRGMLRIAAKFLTGEGEEAEIGKLIEGLEGIYVKHFSFDEDWAYDTKITDRIRNLVPAGFEKLIRVRSRNEENVDILVRPIGDDIDGLIIIAAEPDEFTVVHLVGRIDIAQLSELDGHFGIPDLDIEEDSSRRREEER